MKRIFSILLSTMLASGLVAYGREPATELQTEDTISTEEQNLDLYQDRSAPVGSGEMVNGTGG